MYIMHGLERQLQTMHIPGWRGRRAARCFQMDMYGIGYLQE